MVRCSFGRFSFYYIYLHYLCLQATSVNVARNLLTFHSRHLDRQHLSPILCESLALDQEQVLNVLPHTCAQKYDSYLLFQTPTPHSIFPYDFW